MRATGHATTCVLLLITETIMNDGIRPPSLRCLAAFACGLVVAAYVVDATPEQCGAGFSGGGGFDAATDPPPPPTSVRFVVSQENLPVLDSARNDKLGSSVATVDDFVAVGAPRATVAGFKTNPVTGNNEPFSVMSAGRVLLYRTLVSGDNAGGWVLEQTVLSPDPQFNAAFGSAVSFAQWGDEGGDDHASASQLPHGGRMVLFVGSPGRAAPSASNSLTAAGCIDVFQRDARDSTAPWSHTQTLFQSMPQKFALFGYSVDAGGSVPTVVVGAPGTDTSGRASMNLDSLVSVLHVQSADATAEPTQWEESQVIEPADDALSAGILFGRSVCVSDTYIAVGAATALSADGSASTGAVYVYSSSATLGPESVLQPRVKLFRSNSVSGGELYGASVACSGGLLVAGAPGAGGGAGAAVVNEVVLDSAGDIVDFSVVQDLTAPNGAAGDAFGSDVDINSRSALLIVGSPQSFSAAGSALLFQRDDAAPTGEPWILAETLRDDGLNAAQGQLGQAVAISASTVATGAPAAQLTGAAVVFSIVAIGHVAPAIVELPYVASMRDEQFGEHIALDGLIAVVSAPGLRSGSTASVGTVAVLAPSASGDFTAPWNVVCLLVPENIEVGLMLGESLSFDGVTVVAGAPSRNRLVLFAAAAAGDPSGGFFECASIDGGITGDDLPSYSFGHSVALAADTMIVGVANNSPDRAGAAYFFSGAEHASSPCRNWEMRAAMYGSRAGVTFGTAVVTDGRIAIISAPAAGSGILRVFARSAESWDDVAEVVADDLPVESNGLGQYLAFDDPVLLAADHLDQVFAFARSGDSLTFTFTQLLVASDASGAVSGYGAALDLRLPNAIVGAPFDKTLHNNAGSAYIFTLSDPENPAGTWIQLDKWVGTAGLQADAKFGSSVVLSDYGFALAGSPYYDTESSEDSGAVEIGMLPPGARSVCFPSPNHIPPNLRQRCARMWPDPLNPIAAAVAALAAGWYSTDHAVADSIFVGGGSEVEFRLPRQEPHTALLRLLGRGDGSSSPQVHMPTRPWQSMPATIVVSNVQVKRGGNNDSGGEADGALDEQDGGAIVASATAGLRKLVLRDISISLSVGRRGGAMYLSGAELYVLVERCTFFSNTALSGGAIYAADQAVAAIRDSQFSDNTAISAPGGAIVATESASVMIQNCSFQGGAASSGGAIAAGLLARVSILEADFRTNVAARGGGAIFVGSAAMDISVTNCTFISNVAERGAAINIEQGSGAHIIGSYLSDNVAAQSGGALRIEGSGVTSVVNSTVAGNSADEGGGISCSKATLVISGVVVSGNLALSTGGGLSSTDCTVSAELSSFEGNSVAQATTTSWHGGGALFYASEATNLTSLLVNMCTFSANSAPVGGALLHVDLTESSCLQDSLRCTSEREVRSVSFVSSHWSGNLAPVGNDATFLYTMVPQALLNQVLQVATGPVRLEVRSPVNSGVSGAVWEEFVVAVVDWFGNDSFPNPGSSVVASTNGSAAITFGATADIQASQSIARLTMSLRGPIQGSARITFALQPEVGVAPASVDVTFDPCEPGFEKSLTDPTSCAACAAGTFSDGVLCIPCPTGRYSPTPGASKCLSCGNGTEPDGNNIRCTRCPANAVANGTRCRECPVSMMPDDATGRGSCTDCPRGQERPIGALTCQPCRAGSSRPAGSSLCAPCEAGTYADVAGLVNCRLASAGHIVAVPGAVSESPCGVGTVPDANATECTRCESGTASAGSVAKCTRCENGTAPDASAGQCERCLSYEMSNGTLCVPCPASMMPAEATNRGSCAPCPSGQARSPGSSKCEPCPAGSKMSPGAVACELCEYGTYTDVPGLSVCRSPSPGYIVPVRGAVSQTACGVGTIPSTNASVCIRCAPGSVSSGTVARCARCNNGTAPDGSAGACVSCRRDSVGGGITCSPCAAHHQPDVRGGRLDRCVPCEPGRERLREAELCVDCPPGRHGPGNEACRDCPIGEFQDLPGQQRCKAPAPGWVTQTINGLSVGQVKCPPGTAARNSSECTPCRRGEVSDAGAVDCHSCIAGEFEPRTPDGGEAGFCEKCPTGTFSAAGAFAECTPCPDGESSDVGSASCSRCGGGHHVVQGVCQPCGPGRYSVDGSACQQCPAGHVAAAASQQCRPCDAGFSPTLGNETCARCADNAVSPGGAQQCVQCRPGTRPDRLQDKCVGCPSGTAGDSSGSACLSCPPGRYSGAPNSTTCRACSPGRFASSEGRTECATPRAGFVAPNALAETGCTAGHFADSGQLCTACEAGWVSGPRSNGCVQCSAGERADSLNASCIDCGNTAVSTAGALSCTACAAGSVADPVARSVCTLCPPGFRRKPQEAQCVACEAGTRSVANRTSCDACQVGSISSTAASSKCEECPAGKFESGQRTQCLDCPAGKASRAAGSDSCEACAAGTISEAGSNQCVACPAGSREDGNRLSCFECQIGYTSQRAATFCTPCPTGSVAPSLGSTSCSPCAEGYKATATGCELCRDGTYARSDHTECIPCPEVGVRCSKGLLVVLDGYWLPESALISQNASIVGSNTSSPFGMDLISAQTVFYECPPDACKVGNGTLECSTGRAGVLCATCVDDPPHYAVGTECLPCPQSKAGNWILLVFMVLLLCAATSFMIHRAIVSWTQERHTEGGSLIVVVKTTLNYLQIAGMVRCTPASRGAPLQ